MSVKAIFLDAAGTLIRPAEPVGVTYCQFAAHHGISAEPEALMQAFRRVWKTTSPPLHSPGEPSLDDDRNWWQTLVGDVFAQVLGHSLPQQTLEALFGELYAFYALSGAWVVFDDVRPALNDLAQDHRLVVLSNFDRRLRTILEGHDLARFFERIIISSEVGAAKPHLRMFEAALDHVGCGPEHCMHIGDDAKCDGEGALKAGVRFFAVNRPGNGLDTLVQKVRSGAYSGLRSLRI